MAWFSVASTSFISKRLPAHCSSRLSRLAMTVDTSIRKPKARI